MKFAEITKLTIKNIIYRKTRSWLTILGVIIGIAAVVGLLGLGDALKDSIVSQLSELGGDKLIITPGKSQQVFSRQFNEDDAKDIDASATIVTQETGAPITENEAQLINKLPNIMAAAGIVQERYTVNFRSEFTSVNVQFIDPVPMEIIEQPEIISGRWLSSNDKLSCVLGYNVANEVFAREVRVGDLISINDKNCRVIGVLDEIGGFSGSDDNILINLGAVKTFKPDYEKELTYVNVRVEDTDLLDETEESISNLLKQLHNTIEEDFTILTFASIQEQVQSIVELMNAFIAGIAGISLLVGAIGISNTMLTSVMERTREIGIFKAIGAKSKDVQLLVITEAAIMSLIGGLIGILMGIILAQGIIYILPIMFPVPDTVEFKFVLNITTIIASIIISIVIGAVSGYFPAKKAAELDPIKAISYE